MAATTPTIIGPSPSVESSAAMSASISTIRPASAPASNSTGTVVQQAPTQTLPTFSSFRLFNPRVASLLGVSNSTSDQEIANFFSPIPVLDILRGPTPSLNENFDEQDDFELTYVLFGSVNELTQALFMSEEVLDGRRVLVHRAPLGYYRVRADNLEFTFVYNDREGDSFDLSAANAQVQSAFSHVFIHVPEKVPLPPFANLHDPMLDFYRLGVARQYNLNEVAQLIGRDNAASIAETNSEESWLRQNGYNPPPGLEGFHRRHPNSYPIIPNPQLTIPWAYSDSERAQSVADLVHEYDLYMDKHRQEPSPFSRLGLRYHRVFGERRAVEDLPTRTCAGQVHTWNLNGTGEGVAQNVITEQMWVTLP